MEAPVGLCHNSPMLRGSFLAAALVTLLGFGSGTGHTRNGRIAFDHIGGSDRAQIYSTTATGTKRHLLTPDRKASSLSPSFSPNGRRIVFARAFKEADLWLMRADGSHRRPLTHTPGVREADPGWSPDGKQVVFAVTQPHSLAGIWIIGVDGRNRQQLTHGADSHPSWSPNGAVIAFQRYDASTQIDSILVVPAAGGAPTTLSNNAPGFSDLQPDWSPNGSRILFASDRTDQPEPFELDLWVMNADGSDLRQITNTPSRDEHDPVWSPNGRLIAYVGESAIHGSSSYQLYVSRPNGTNRRIITHACGSCAIINDDPSWQPLR